MGGRRILASLMVAASTGLATSAPASATSNAAAMPEAPQPTVTGPVTGGNGTPSLLTTSFDLGQFGYVGAEYFLSGTATAYTSAQPLTTDGTWTVTPQSTAPYTTRVVVYRPAKAKDFNGTVSLEWLNVSPGFDNPADYMLSHLERLRSGEAWVAVSAQAVGVQGGQSTVGGVAPGGVKAADPERYAALTHPGDSYSYDIFTQAARAVRGDGVSPKPLGDLKPRRVIGVGQSQSATRLVTYVNAVHPQARAFDGFLIHSRFGGGAGLAQAPLTPITVPVGTVIRRDLKVPVMIFLTETDVGPLGAAAARQPDTKRIRTWEVAGTAHADAYTGALAFGDDGDGAAELALLDVTKPLRGSLNCNDPINTGPHYAVLMAAVRHLDRWVRDGKPPPTAPPLETTGGPPRTSGGVSVPTFVITRDEYGNAVGGVRTAFVDAPRAAVTGELNSGGTFCSLFGNTRVFDAATIAALYPSQQQFLGEFDRSLARSVKQGFLLQEEARRLRTAIRQVPFPAA